VVGSDGAEQIAEEKSTTECQYTFPKLFPKNPMWHRLIEHRCHWSGAVYYQISAIVTR
jgi:hypothetical protein